MSEFYQRTSGSRFFEVPVGDSVAERARRDEMVLGVVAVARHAVAGQVAVAVVGQTRSAHRGVLG